MITLTLDGHRSAFVNPWHFAYVRSRLANSPTGAPETITRIVIDRDTDMLAKETPEQIAAMVPFLVKFDDSRSCAYVNPFRVLTAQPVHGSMVEFTFKDMNGKLQVNGPVDEVAARLRQAMEGTEKK